MKRSALTLALLCACYLASAEAKKNWDKVDFEKAERDHEADDDPELLVSDDTLIAKEMEKRKNNPLSPPEDATLK